MTIKSLVLLVHYTVKEAGILIQLIVILMMDKGKTLSLLQKRKKWD